MKTMRKFGAFFLCLAVLCVLMTLPAFAETEYVECVIRDTGAYYVETDFDMTLLESLDELAASGTESFSIDVRDLRMAECYEIVIYRDFEETIHGAIYVLDGAYCYLNYVNLGNQYFDADGYFSYRSGEVTLTRAETYRGGIEKALTSLTEGDSYGEVSGTLYTDEKLAMTLFWIGFAVLGFLAPIPFLLVGLLLPRSKKLGYPRYWRKLVYIAGAWMALALLLAVILVVI